MIRSAYGIQGDGCNDCVTAVFCPCCSTNQLYQTTKLYGPPSIDSGSNFNVGSWIHPFGSANFQDCLCSFFCMPCAMGKLMEETMGMPWCMGCCCVNVCAARNLIRYQYRIRGNELVEECTIPYGLKCYGNMTNSSFMWFALCGIFVAASMQQLQEVQARSNQRQTLSNPSIPSARYLVRERDPSLSSHADVSDYLEVTKNE